MLVEKKKDSTVKNGLFHWGGDRYPPIYDMWCIKVGKLLICSKKNDQRMSSFIRVSVFDFLEQSTTKKKTYLMIRDENIHL